MLNFNFDDDETELECKTGIHRTFHSVISILASTAEDEATGKSDFRKIRHTSRPVRNRDNDC